VFEVDDGFDEHGFADAPARCRGGVAARSCARRFDAADVRTDRIAN